MYTNFKLMTSHPLTGKKFNPNPKINFQILGSIKNTQNKTYLIFRCEKCSKDIEIYGKGIFLQTQWKLSKGEYRCGCAKIKQYNQRQNEILLKRFLANKNFKFVQFIGDYKGRKTIGEFKCPVHGVWKTKIQKVLTGYTGCPKCGLFHANPELEKETIKIFQKIFPNLYNFKKSDRIKPNGGRCFWKFNCKICSDDRFVQYAGSDHEFESHVSNLKSGRTPCRCSWNYKWSKKEYEYRIKFKIKDEDLPYEFVSWLDDNAGYQAKFIYKCHLHGENVVSCDNFLQDRIRCPDCTKEKGRKVKPLNQAYVNLIYLGNGETYIKYGISSDFSKRLNSLRSNNVVKIENFLVYHFESESNCRKAESECKIRLVSRVLPKETIPDGYTETTYLTNLEKIKEIYSNNGGKIMKTRQEENK